MLAGSSSAQRRSSRSGGRTASRRRLSPLYQSPGGNAIASADEVRKTLERLKASFPEGIDYKITYDTTVFVNESIHEVIKTLIEAFVLVVIVVYLFLGNLRATLIPLIAVPVSLIGTFAVMLALGYSANTVSLLALVLAIGIVVDDAIVVVEAVEHQLEADPQLSPAEAARRAMGEITAPIIAITLVLLSVFVPVAFIPGISGELFRQFAVAVSVSMLISAVNALTLSPALCAVFLRASHGPKRGPIRYVLAGIDRARDGYASIVARLVRRAALGLIALVGCSGRGRLAVQGHADRLSACRGPGRDLRRDRVCRKARRSTAPTRWPSRWKTSCRDTKGVAGVTEVVGYSLLDGQVKSNTAMLIMTLLPFERAQRRGALGRWHHRRAARPASRPSARPM